jgi:hypothetical protein
VVGHLVGLQAQDNLPPYLSLATRVEDYVPARDVPAWSRVTRVGPVFRSMSDELVAVACADGRTRYDVPGAPYADGTDPVWMGRNGGLGSTVIVDGPMAGLWWWREGRVETDLRVRLTRGQRSEPAEEVDRMTTVLGGPERP